MRARRFICPGLRQIELEEFETGPLPDNAILVQNEFTVVSVGTEIYNWIHGGSPGREATFPHTTGYCSAGRVLEVGAAVTDVQPGDRVAGQGLHASHGVLRKPYQRVPDNVPARDAAFLVMGAISLHGIRVAHIELGESVAVLGLGLVGQLASSLAQLAGGMPVIAIDLDEQRLAKAKARGAAACINPAQIEDAPQVVRDLCVEDGCNVVIEATGKPAVYPLAVKLACMAGRVVALGSPRGTVEMNFLDEVHLREVSILGAIQPRTPNDDHVYYHWTKDRERDLVLRLMAQGRLPVADLVTHEARPEDCLEIYTMLADCPQGALGVVFDWR